MANVIFGNFTLQGANHSFSVIWKLTRAMKKAGWNVMAHSNGDTKTSAGTNNNDSWGSNADPSDDTYPAFDAKAAWIVLSGPKTVKVPITSAPSGTFIRGEKVTQTGSGVEGEILGYAFDTGGSTGWLSIADRTGVSSTYTNSWTTGLITGASSGATVTPSATPIPYVREIVFWKNSANTTGGTVYYECVDPGGENADLFSVLAASAGATATVAPGGGGTGNAFPASALTCLGTGGSTSHGTWFSVTTNMTNNAQISAVSNVPGAGTTADGSFWAIIGSSATSNAGHMIGFHKLNDTEPADLDPYAWQYVGGDTPAAWSRTANTSATSSVLSYVQALSNSSNVGWRGFCARGSGTTRDVATYFYAGTPTTGGNATVGLVANGADTHKIANHPSAASPPILRLPFRLLSEKTGAKIFKGSPKWFMAVPTGAGFDTYDTKTWLQIISTNGTTNCGIIIGPYDGTTTPTQ